MMIVGIKNHRPLLVRFGPVCELVQPVKTVDEGVFGGTVVIRIIAGLGH